jgi:hypothetical protein
MNNVVREIPLPNGLVVRFADATRRYFGDYHQVRLEISCEVPVTLELFEDQATFDKARRVLGTSACYKKHVEHQGVPTLKVEETVQQVIQHFIDHSLGYFSSENFPRRLVHTELNRLSLRSRNFISLHSNG